MVVEDNLGWYPDGLRPVRLPGSADTARVAARQVAAMLEADLGARALLVGHAREDWAGRHRGDPGDLLAGFVAGFAPASHHLAPATRDGLLDPEGNDEPWRQHQLALLISGDSAAVDPVFLAGAAGAILVTGTNPAFAGGDALTTTRPYEQGYPPMWMSADGLWGEPRLGAPQVVALQALAGNAEASWQFATGGQDNVAALLRPLDIDGMRGLADHGRHLGLPGAATEADARAAIEALGERALTNALVDAVEARPERLADVAIGADGHATVPPAGRLLLDVMTVTAEGDVPEPTREAIAEALGRHDHRYLDVLAVEIDSETTTDTDGIGIRTAEHFLRELTVVDGAAPQVDRAIDTWQHRELEAYFTENGIPDDIRRVGAVGMLDATAEANAIIDAEQERVAGNQRHAARIDAALGAVPIGGTAMQAFNALNGIAGAEAQVSAGNGLVDWVTDDPDTEEARREALEVLADQEARHLDMLGRAAYNAGHLGTPDQIRNSPVVNGVDFFDPDGNILPIDDEDRHMTNRQLEAYMNWLASDVVMGGNRTPQGEVDLLAQDRREMNDPFGHSYSIAIALE